MSEAAGRHCHRRLFEWTATGIMLGIAFTLFVSPHSISNSAFRLLMQARLSQEEVANLFFVFGVIRIVALIANGSIPFYGPIMRSSCAAVGAVLWFQLGWALVQVSSIQSTVTPGVSVYFMLTLGEIASCYRAAVDGKRYRLINVLGPLPILQVIAGAIILAVCAFVWMRGTKRETPPDEALQNMLRMDGPIAVTIAILRNIADGIEKTRACCQDIAEEARRQSRLLEDISRRER